MERDSDSLQGKKDETPYLIFRCGKCGHYLYVRQTGQKTKKCLRPHCGRAHPVEKINAEQVVQGLHKAKDTVKEKQHGLAVKELGAAPDFCCQNELSIPAKKILHNKDHRNNYKNSSNVPEAELKIPPYVKFSTSERAFISLLKNVARQYEECPHYVLDMMAEEYTISKEKLKVLIPRFIARNYLLPAKKGYYRINLAKLSS